MRNNIIAFSYSLYVVFIVGFFFHTCVYLQVLHKYTYPYLVLLIGLLFSLPFVFWLLFFLSKPTNIKRGKKRILISPLKKILVFIVLLCILLTPFEIYLRNKYNGYEQTTYRYTIENFHPFLQFQPTKGLHLHINSWGFRGDEISKEKPKNTYRIFVLGGSTVYNSSFVYEKTIAKLLQDELQKRYPRKKIEIQNAGVDRYTTQHSLMQYLFYIKDFSPDMIIMWHGVNDWYYSCSPKQYVATPFRSDYAHYLGGDARMVFEHFSPNPLITMHSVLFYQIGIFIKDNWYSDIFSFLGKIHPFPGIYSKNYPHKTYEMKKYPSLSSYKRNIQELIDMTKKDKVVLILGNQPFLYKKNISDKEQKVLFFPAASCSLENGAYPSLASMIKAMNTFNTSMEQKANENTIPFVNLEKAIPKNLDYFTDDVHYSEKGNYTMAGALYETIVTGGFIEK